MGLPVTLTVRDAQVPRAAVGAAFRQLRAIDRRFSPYRPESDVSRIAAGTLVLADAHPDVGAVLDRCAAARAASGGAFDVRATGRLDPSGLVKGWAGDRAAAILAAAGVASFCLELGGDVVVRGGPWRIGVRAPATARGGETAGPPGPAAASGRAAGAPVVEVLTLVDGAVATSGRDERGDHVIDPRRGRPATAVLSATVVAGDLETADVWATAAFVDPGCLPHDAAALLIDARGVLTTPALDRYRPSSPPYCAAYSVRSRRTSRT